MEIWKTINKFPDYVVSNFGKIKRIKNSKTSKIGKILKPQKSSCGYRQINLYLNGKMCTQYIHLLVLETFIGSRSDLFCNHIDGDKTNNRLNNLEWVTQSENEKHAYKNNLKNPVINSKLSLNEVSKIRELLGQKKFTQKEISKIFNVSHQLISMIKLNRIWNRGTVND